MSKVVSGRVPDGLADELAAYASKRGVKRGVLVEAGCRMLLDFAKTGVPDLPEREAAPKPAKAVSATRPEPVSIEAIRAKAARFAAEEKAERERKYAERGW